MRRKERSRKRWTFGLQRRCDRLYVLFEYLAVLPHPRPAPLGVDRCIGLERHTLPGEFDNNASDVSCVLCAYVGHSTIKGNVKKSWDTEDQNEHGAHSGKYKHDVRRYRNVGDLQMHLGLGAGVDG